MKLRKIILTILLAIIVALNFTILPVGGPLIWIPISFDIAVILVVFIGCLFAILKVGADSERGGKDE